ncbi:uncharacterized protein [Drosophila bipectinata]|uniref:uncharacterized protein n=1 Tax=Drosophila bipectinata TaxID=42026 RepID=UPI001C8A26A0|nr:uncharacterized protein LOC108125562 [Drosophila bipectinata]
MRSCYLALGLLLIVAASVEARGGRGRGGGSFGGLFGGWRKYKKPSSSGGGRRVISGSPVHTAMTVPKPPLPPPPPKPMIPPPKQQIPSYPRQQMPAGYGYGSYSTQGGGTFYSNAQGLPPGAVYYAQPPTGMNRGSGTGDFLTGMLAGHMMNNLLFGHRHHVSHVYHRNGEGDPSSQGTGRQIIIVNNGQPEGVAQNETSISQEVSPVASPKNPLTDENEEGEEEVGESGAEAAESEGESSPISSEESPESGTTPPPSLPSGGIICFPIMLNETDPESPDRVREVERIVCFPAPARNPENFPSTTTSEPPIVAGDIGGGAEETGAEGAGDGGSVEGSDASTDAPIEVASYVAGRASEVQALTF